MNLIKILVGLVVAALLALPLAAAEPLEALMHTFAIIMAILAVYVGYGARELFAGKFKTAVNFIFIGVLVLVSIHASEIITEVFKVIALEHEQIELMEHVLFYAGMSLIIYGFYNMVKVIKEVAKRGK